MTISYFRDAGFLFSGGRLGGDEGHDIKFAELRLIVFVR